MGWSDNGDTGDCDSSPCALQDPIVFATVEDWLQVVAPHLVLTDCMEAMKTAMSSGRPVVALAYKRCGRQHLEHGEYANWRHNTHLRAGCSHKWDVAPQVQCNPLSVLRC